MQKMPSFLPFLVISLLLCGVGWGGLFGVVWFTLPYLGPRWLFFFMMVLAFSGLALPVVYFFNYRFGRVPRADTAVILRQALWVGVYFDLLVWLQLGRTLTLPLALLLAAGVALIESLLRMWERSKWKPPETSHA